MEGLSSFGQMGRGMIERGMREVVAGSLWQLLWPSEKGSFTSFGRENPKKGGQRLVFISSRDRENLGMSVPFFKILNNILFFNMK